jgi:hypothetical protein
LIALFNKGLRKVVRSKNTSIGGVIAIYLSPSPDKKSSPLVREICNSPHVVDCAASHGVVVERQAQGHRAAMSRERIE